MNAQATAAAAPPARSAHDEAWGALARAHAAVAQRLQGALAAADFPPLPWYEALATVAEAPDRRMKMGELAEALVITRGGLTKLVDRLVAAGLLERSLSETDRRVSYATLTPAGVELLAGMRPVVIEELRTTFAAGFSVAQADDLREALARLHASACAAR